MTALTLLAGCTLVGAGDDDASGGTRTSRAPSTTSPSTSPSATSSSPPPAAATRPAVSPRFFGVHDSDPLGGPSGWPQAPVGSFRAWDAGVSWRELETSPGAFDWRRLDEIVRTSRAHGADVLLVLGQTPQFHARNPSVASAYGSGASSMPKLAAWKRYVAAVAKRYARQGVVFQVWNEANVINYWSGTTAQMAQLTKTAYEVLARVSPRATLVAPALVTRLDGQRAWLDRFYAERIGGRPVADFLDIVSLQLHPLADGSPEDSMDLLAQSRALLARHGVSKPVWNTEINYGLTGGGVVETLSPKQQAAQVARTYLLNAANDVGRVYWYSWDRLDIVNTTMVATDRASPTRAGRAFGTVRSWLEGASVQSCDQDDAGTYVCVLVHPEGVRNVYWNPTRTVTVTAPATQVDRLDGSKQAVPSGQVRLRVGYSPVLVR